MDIGALLAETGKAVIQTENGSFGIVYHAWWETRFSDEDWARFRTMAPRDYYKEALPKMLQSWELVSGGESIPITAEAMEQYGMPTRLLGMIEAAIGASTKSGKGNASSSPAG